MFPPTDSAKNAVDMFPTTDKSKDIHSIGFLKETSQAMWPRSLTSLSLHLMAQQRTMIWQKNRKHVEGQLYDLAERAKDCGGTSCKYAILKEEWPRTKMSGK